MAETTSYFTREQVLEHRGNRVLVAIHDSCRTATGVLRFVTPDDSVVLAGPDGHETKLALNVVASITDARTECAVANCGRYNNVFETREDPPRILCATHYRKWAYDQPPPVMVCTECDTGASAVYSPGDKTYACAPCHLKRSGLTGLGVEARALQARCRSANIDSPEHDWKQVRGQWLCRTCHVKVRTKPLHAEDMRQW